MRTVEKIHHVSFAHLQTRRRFVRPGIDPAVCWNFAHGGICHEEVVCIGIAGVVVYGLRMRKKLVSPVVSRSSLQWAVQRTGSSPGGSRSLRRLRTLGSRLRVLRRWRSNHRPCLRKPNRRFGICNSRDEYSRRSDEPDSWFGQSTLVKTDDRSACPSTNESVPLRPGHRYLGWSSMPGKLFRWNNETATTATDRSPGIAMVCSSHARSAGTVAAARRDLFG